MFQRKEKKNLQNVFVSVEKTGDIPRICMLVIYYLECPVKYKSAAVMSESILDRTLQKSEGDKKCS